MAYGEETHHENLNLIHSHTHAHKPSTFQWNNGRKIHIRRRKLHSVRLGGKKFRDGVLLVRLCRKIKLRWLKLKYTCMLKRLKDFYDSVVKDLMEARATLETVQRQILMEAYFTVPVMGVSVASIPSYVSSQTGPNRVYSKN